MKAWNRITGLVVLCTLALVVFVSPYTYGLSYQKDVDVKFTFNPFLAISLSSADLIIPNLNPGTSAYSNTISIDVDTNNIVGYTLSAKVGDGTNYTNDKLVNTNTNVTFDNITASSVLASFGDNKWGYTLGTVNTDSLYSGLIYNEDTIINATTNASGTASEGYTGTNTTNFTIGAKASDTMASGDYKNVIVFTAVSNMPPFDLSGTTWLLNTYLSFPRSNEDMTYQIDFTSNNISYSSLLLRPPLERVFYGVPSGTMVYSGGWGGYENYRTISITGGKDSINTELVNWLQENAIQQ